MCLRECSFRSNRAIILKYWNGLTKKISQMSGAMSGCTIHQSRSIRSHWEALLSLLSLAFVYECIYTKSEYEQIKQTGFDYQTLSWMTHILTDCPDDFDYEKDEPRKAGGVTKQLPRFLRFYGAKQIEPYFLSTGDSKSLAVLASDSFSISPSTLPVQINSRV